MLHWKQAPKGPIDILVTTVRTQGVSAVYRGLSAMVIGNTAKAGVRFFAFDQFKDLLKDSEGKTTGARSVLGKIPLIFMFFYRLLRANDHLKRVLIYIVFIHTFS